MNRTLVVIGLLCLAAGLLWPWLKHLPFGRLPGDILIVREKFRFFLPLATGLLVSLLLTLFFWIFRK
jgi:hypothetical protein